MKRILVWIFIVQCLIIALPAHAGQEPEVISALVPLVHQGEIRQVAWSSNGSLIALASSLGVWLYQANRLDLNPTLLNTNDRPVSKLVFSPEPDHLGELSVGSKVAVAYDDGAIEIWDLSSNTPLASFTKLERGNIEVLAFHSLRSQLLAATDRGDLYLWSLRDVTEAPKIIHLGEPILAVSEDWTMIATSDSEYDTKISIWEFNQDTRSYERKHELVGHSDIVDTIQFNRSKTFLASVSFTGRDGIFIWKIETGEFLGVIEGNTRTLAFNSEGNLLATDAAGFNVALWDVNEFPHRRVLQPGTGYLSLRGHTSDLIDFTFSPDGTHVASVADDQIMRIWDLTPLLEYRAQNS